MRVVLVATALLAGCYQPVVPVGVRCSESGECPEGQRCDQVRNLCEGSPVDARPGDVADAPSDAPIDAALIDAPVLGAWGLPQRLDAVNTASVETDPAISSDGLELFFASDRGTAGDQDIYRTVRLSTALPFGAPTLVPELSAPGIDFAPHLTADNLTIYFARNSDIYRATRANRQAPFGPPVLDTELSSGLVDVNPAISPDGLSACVTRELTPSDRDLYLYVRGSTTASWGTGQLMTALQTAGGDSGAEFTADPLELYFHSDRSGGTDIFRAARSTTATPFGSPLAVAELTTQSSESDPSVTADRRIIVFERVAQLMISTR